MSRPGTYLKSWVLHVASTASQGTLAPVSQWRTPRNQLRVEALHIPFSCRSDMVRDYANPARGACGATSVIPGMGNDHDPPFVTYQARCVSN